MSSESRKPTKVSVLLYAVAKELAGTDQIELQLEYPTSSADVMQAISETEPKLTSLLPSCRLAVNDSYVTMDIEIAEDSEIALIPPVSGG